MKLSIPTFLAVGLLTCILTSCGPLPEENKPTSEPVLEPIAQSPEPVEPADPTAGWRTLKDDTKLPTDAQLSEGAESSLGAGSPSGPDDHNPSTSIKPPPSEPEDQLAPSE